MKLNLPALLHAALLRCMMAAAPLVCTLATGTLAVGGIVLTMHQAQAEQYTLWSNTQIANFENSTIADSVIMSFSTNANLYLSSSNTTYNAGTIYVNYWNITGGYSGKTYTFTGSIVSYSNKGNINYQGWGDNNTNNTYIFEGDVSGFSADIISSSGTGSYAGGLNLVFNDENTDNVTSVSGTGSINLAGSNSEYLTYSYSSGKTISINNKSITAPVINFNSGATYNLNCVATAGESLNIDDDTTLNVNAGFSSVDVSLGDNATLYIAAGTTASNTGDLDMGTGASLIVDGTYSFSGSGTRTGASATINETGSLIVTHDFIWSASVSNAGNLTVQTDSTLGGYIATSASNNITVVANEAGHQNLVWGGTLSSTGETFYSVDVDGATIGLTDLFALDLGEDILNGSYTIMTDVGGIIFTGDYIDATVLKLNEQGSEWSYDSDAKTLSVTIYDIEHITWNGEGTEDYWRDENVWLNDAGEAVSFQKLDYVTIGSSSDSADAAAYTIDVVMDLILGSLHFEGARDWNLTTGDYSTIDVHGALTKSGSGTATVGLDIISTESITVNGGTLNLAGVTHSTGDIILASGATLNFSGDVASVAGTVSLGSSASLIFGGSVSNITSLTLGDNSYMTVTGSASNIGNISVGSGASLDFEQGFTGTSSNVTLAGGSLTLGDDSTLLTLAITAANSSLTVESGSTLTITQSGYGTSAARRETLYDFTINIEENATINDSATFWVGQGHVTATGGGTYNLERLLIGYSSVGGEIKFTVDEDTTMEITNATTTTGTSAAFSLGAVAADASMDVKGTLILNSGISVWGATTSSTLTVYNGGTLQLNNGIYAEVASTAANPEIKIQTGATLSLGNSTVQTAHDSDITVSMATGTTLTTNGESSDGTTTTYQIIDFADNATINFVVHTDETLVMGSGVIIENGSAIISGGGTLSVIGQYDSTTDSYTTATQTWTVTSGSTLDFSLNTSVASGQAAGGENTITLQDGASLSLPDQAYLTAHIAVVGGGNVITAGAEGTITLAGTFIYGNEINSLSFDDADLTIACLTFDFDNGIASGVYTLFTNASSYDLSTASYQYIGLLEGQEVTVTTNISGELILTVTGRGHENLVWASGSGDWSSEAYWTNANGDSTDHSFIDGDNVTFGSAIDSAGGTITLSDDVETNSISFVGDGSWSFVSAEGTNYSITNDGLLSKSGAGMVTMDVAISSLQGMTASGGKLIFNQTVTDTGDITINDASITFDAALGSAGDVNVTNGSLLFNSTVGSLDSVWVNAGGSINFGDDVTSITELFVASGATGVSSTSDLLYVSSISLAGGTNTFKAVTCNTYLADGSMDERGTLSISGGTNTFNGTVKAGYIELNGGTNSFSDIVVYDVLDIRSGTTTLNGSVTFNSADLGNLTVRSGATLISNYQHTGLENILIYGSATFNKGLDDTAGTLSINAASAVLNLNGESTLGTLNMNYAGSLNVTAESTINSLNIYSKGGTASFHATTTIGTLRVGSGASLLFTESSSIGTLTFSSTHTLSLQSLDGEEVTLTVNNGAITSNTSSSASNELGGATYWNVGANTTLSLGYGIVVNTGDSLDIAGAGTVEMSSLRLGSGTNQGTLAVTVSTGSTLKITDTKTDYSNTAEGLILCAGSAGTTGQINVYGTLESNAGLSIYSTASSTGTGEINVYSGGTLQLNRGTLASIRSSNSTLHVNIADGATLSLGNTVADDGTAITTDYSSAYSINLESGAIITGNGMTYDGADSFTASAQTDVYFSFTYDSDAHIIVQSDAGDTLVLHDVFSTDLEYVVVTGGGTVQILETGTNRATYHIQVTGGTTLDATAHASLSASFGTLSNGYLVLDHGSLLMQDGGNIDRIIVAYGADSSITTTAGGDGSLTLSSGIQYESVQYENDFDLSLDLDGTAITLTSDFRFNFLDGIEAGEYELFVNLGSLTIDGGLAASGTYSLDDIDVQGLSGNQDDDASYFTYDSATGTLTLTVVGTIFNTLSWDGASGDEWNTSDSSTAWVDDKIFANNDTVNFDSSYVDVSTMEVLINEKLSVSNMYIKGDGVTWSFDGTGSIAKISQLTKTGTSSASIDVAVGELDVLNVQGGTLSFGSTVEHLGEVTVSGGSLIVEGDVTEVSSIHITTDGSASLNGTGSMDSIGNITMGVNANSLSIAQNITTAGNITIHGGSAIFANIDSMGSLSIDGGTGASFGAVGDINGALTLTGTSDTSLTVSFDSINGSVGDITIDYADVTLAKESNITTGAISLQNGSLTGLGSVEATSLTLIDGSFTTTGDLTMSLSDGSSIIVGNDNSVFTIGGDLQASSIELYNGVTTINGSTKTLTLRLKGGTSTFNGTTSAYSLEATNGGSYTFNSALVLDSNLTLSGTGTTLNLTSGMRAEGDVSISGTSTLTVGGATSFDDLTITGGSATFNSTTTLTGNITISGNSSLSFNDGLSTAGDTTLTSSGSSITFNGGTSGKIALADFNIAETSNMSTFNLAAGTSLSFTDIVSSTTSGDYSYKKLNGDLTLNMGAGSSFSYDELLWVQNDDILITGDGGTVTLSGIFLGYNSAATSTLTIDANNTLILTGENFDHNSHYSSFNLAGNGISNTVTVSGTLIANTGVQVYVGTGVLDIESGGTLQLNAGLMAARDNADELTTTLKSCSTLILGNQSTTTDYSYEMIVYVQDNVTIKDNGVADETTVAHTIAFAEGATVTLATTSADSTLVFAEALTARTASKDASTYNYVYSDIDSSFSIEISGAGTVELAGGASLDAITMDAGSSLSITSTTTANTLSTNNSTEDEETADTVLLVTGGELTVADVDDYTGTYTFDRGVLNITESSSISNDIIMLGQGTIKGNVSLADSLIYIEAWTEADSYTLTLGEGVTLGEGFNVDLTGLIAASDSAGSYIIFSGITQEFVDNWSSDYYTTDEGFVCEWAYDAKTGSMVLKLSSNQLHWDGETDTNWSNMNWNDSFGADSEYLDGAIVTIGSESHISTDTFTIKLDEAVYATSISLMGDGQWTLTNQGNGYSMNIADTLSKSGDSIFTIEADITSVARIEVSEGILNINGNVDAVTGSINVAGALNITGALQSASDISVSGDMSVKGATGTVGSITVNSGASLSFDGGLDSEYSTVTLAGGTITFGDDSSIFKYATSDANSVISVTNGATLTIGEQNSVTKRYQTTSYSLTFDIENGSTLTDYNGLWTGQQLVTVTGGGTYESSQLLVGYTSFGSGDQELKVLIDKNTTMEITGTETGTDYSSGTCTAAFSIGAVANSNAFVDVHGTLILNSGMATYSGTGDSTLTVYDGGTLILNDGIHSAVGTADAIWVHIESNATLSVGNTTTVEQSAHDDGIVLSMDSDTILTTNGEATDGITTLYQQIEFANNGTITFDVAAGETLVMMGGVIIEDGKAIISGGGTLAVVGQYDSVTESYITANQNWLVTSGSTIDFSYCDSYDSLAAAGGDGNLTLQNGATLLLANNSNMLTTIVVEGSNNLITTTAADGEISSISIESIFSYSNEINSISFDDAVLSFTSLEFDFSMGISSGTTTLFTDFSFADGYDINWLNQYVTYSGLADGQGVELSLNNDGDLLITVTGRGHENLLWTGGSNEWPTTTDVTYWDNINYTLDAGDEGYDIKMDKFYDGDNVTFGQTVDADVSNTVTLSDDVITSSIAFIGVGDWIFNSALDDEGNAYTITNNGTLTKSGGGTVTINVEITKLLGVTVTEGELYFAKEVAHAGDIIVNGGDLGFADGLLASGDIYVTNGRIGFGYEGAGTLGSVWIYEDASVDFYGTVGYMDELHITSGGDYIIAKGDLQYVGLLTIADGTNEFVGVNTNVYDAEGNITDGGTLDITGGTNTFTGDVTSNSIYLENGINSFVNITTYDELDVRAGTTTLNGMLSFTSEDNGLIVVRSGASLISNYHHSGLENIDIYGVATFNQGITQSAGTINLYTSEATLTINSGDTVAQSTITALNVEAAAHVILNDETSMGTLSFSSESTATTGTATVTANAATSITTLKLDRAGSHLIFTEDSSVGNLSSFTKSATLEVQSNENDDNVLVTINGGAKTTGSSYYTVGVETNIIVGEGTTLSDGKSMWRTGEVMNISGGGTYELTGLLLGTSNNLGDIVVNVGADTLLHITSTGASSTNSDNGFFLNGGRGNTYGVVNVSGTLESNAALSLYGSDSDSSGGEINVASDGTLQLNQGTAAVYNSNNGGGITINVEDGGTLCLGETSTTYGDNATDQFIINLANNATVTSNGYVLDSSSATGFTDTNVTNIYFSFSYESDAKINLVANEGEQIILHHVFVDSFDTLTISGGGTVTVNETTASAAYLQDHDWYVSGGTTLDVSLEAKASDSLGKVATGTVTLNASTLMLQDGGTLDRIIILDGDSGSTITTDAGSGLGTMTLDSGLQYADTVYADSFNLTLDVDGNDLVLGDEFRFNFLSGIEEGSYDLISNIGENFTIISGSSSYTFTSDMSSEDWVTALSSIDIYGLSEDQSGDYEFTLVYDEGSGTLSLSVTGAMITDLTWNAESGSNWSNDDWYQTDDPSMKDQEFSTRYSVTFDSTTYDKDTSTVVIVDGDIVVSEMTFTGADADEGIEWVFNGSGSLSSVAELHKIGYSDAIINVAVGSIDVVAVEHGELSFTKTIDYLGDLSVLGGVLSATADIGAIGDITVKTTGQLIIEGDVGQIGSITVGQYATGASITGGIASVGDIAIGGGSNVVGDIAGSAGRIEIDGGTTAFGSVGSSDMIDVNGSLSATYVSFDGSVGTGSLVSHEAQFFMYDSDGDGTLTVSDGGVISFTGTSETPTLDENGYLVDVDVKISASESAMSLTGDFKSSFAQTVDVASLSISENNKANFDARVHSYSTVSIAGSETSVIFDGGVIAVADITVTGGTVVSNAASSAANLQVSEGSSTTFNDSLTLTGDLTMSGADTVLTFNDSIIKADEDTAISLHSTGGTIIFATGANVELYDFDIDDGAKTTIVIGSEGNGIDLSFSNISADEIYTSRQLDESLTIQLYDGSSLSIDNGEFWFGGDEMTLVRADDSSTGNATVTLNSLLVGYTVEFAEDESILTVGEGVTLQLVGTELNSNNSNCSFTIGGCKREAYVELYGTLIANSGIQVYAGTAELNVYDGGTLQMNAGLMSAYCSTYASISSLAVDIASGATLSLGDQLDTVDYSNLMKVYIHEGATITDNGLEDDGLATTYHSFLFVDDDLDGDVKLNLLSSGEGATLAFGSALSSTEFDLIANIQGEGQVEFAGTAALAEINIETDSTVVISSAVSTGRVGHDEEVAAASFALSRSASNTVSSDMVITTDSGAKLSMDDVAFTAYGENKATITFTNGSSLYTGDNADVVEMSGTVMLSNTFIYDGSINVASGDTLIVNNSTAQDYVILDGGTIQADDSTLIMPIQVSAGKGSITTSDGLTSLVLNGEISYDGAWTDSTTYTIDMTDAVAAEIGDNFKIIFSEDLALNTTYQIFEDVGAGFADSMSNSNYMVVGGSSYIYTWYDSENDEGGTDLWVSVTSREDGYIWRDSDQTWVSETNPTGVGIATSDLNGLDIIFDSSTALSDDGSEYNVASAESELSVGMVTVRGDGNMTITSTSLTADSGFFKNGTGTFTLNTQLSSSDGIYVNEGTLAIGESNSIVDDITITEGAKLSAGNLSFTTTTATGKIDSDSGSIAQDAITSAHLTDIAVMVTNDSTADTDASFTTVAMNNSSITVNDGATASMTGMTVQKGSTITLASDASARISNSSFSGESDLVLEDGANATASNTSFSQSAITMGDSAEADITATSMVDVDIALGVGSTADIETTSLNGTSTITTGSDSEVNLAVTGYVTENTITVSAAESGSTGVANISSSSVSNSTITVESGAAASITTDSFSSSELTLKDNATATVNDATLSSDALIQLAAGATLTLDNVIMTDSFALTQTDNTGASVEYTDSTSSTILNNTTLQANSASNTLSIATNEELTKTTYTVTNFTGLATSESTTSITASGDFLIALVLTDAEYESFIEDFNYKRTIEIVIDDVMIAEAATLNAYVEISSESYGTLTFGAESPGATVVGNNIVFTVPEPSTATLSLMALAGLLARRRRKA